LQQLIDLTHRLIAARVSSTDAAGAACRRIFTALETPGPQQSPGRLETPPACAHLPHALEGVGTGEVPARELAEAFSAIEPRLYWQRRPGAEHVPGNFAEGHANATIIGEGGLEARDDVRMGVSLMAPAVQYPDHRHPPEELYAVLSPGHWRQEARPWHEPGIGGVVYNQPNVIHAMRSTQRPLLAIWCLWQGSQ
jgi:hypothetical protein